MKCLKCNNTLKEGEKTCSNCGQICDSINQKSTTNKKNINILVIAIMIIGGISILVGLILLITNQKEKKTKTE